MDKVFKMTVEWESDDDWGEDYPLRERLKDEAGNELYYVQNLYECPEDACIARDLVSAYEIADFIKLRCKERFSLGLIEGIIYECSAKSSSS